jgi:hypothetical protein
LERLSYYVARLGSFLIIVALIAGMVGCVGDGYNPPPSQNLEIRTWYDLDAVRNNLAGNHTLMNDLDSTTAGYEELASPTANQGKGWQPIGTYHSGAGFIGFTGTFYGQGYEIRDLFINRPNEPNVGLFSGVDGGGVIKDIGAVNVTAIGDYPVGGLAGFNEGAVSNSYSTGNVTGNKYVGGLVGSNDGTVSNSYSTASVTSDSAVGSAGGLVAFNGGTVSNCYATGSVSGLYGAGGLVGSNDGTVSNSYSTGSVTAFYRAGGLVGSNDGTVSNSFWDTETSGRATSAGGTGKTTAEMKDIDTFSGADWNIIAVANPGTRNPSYIWNIVDGETYPFLSWES